MVVNLQHGHLAYICKMTYALCICKIAWSFCIKCIYFFVIYLNMFICVDAFKQLQKPSHKLHVLDPLDILYTLNTWPDLIRWYGCLFKFVFLFVVYSIQASLCFFALIMHYDLIIFFLSNLAKKKWWLTFDNTALKRVQPVGLISLFCNQVILNNDKS